MSRDNDIFNERSVDRDNTSLIPESSKRLSWPAQFFAWCAGSNLDVLRNYPTDHAKHFGAGTAVFMTGVFALISSSYALTSVFKDAEGNTSNSIFIIAVAWAFFIFFLDRYLVSSLSKSKTLWYQFKIALPRALLAILIGIVVARPLELRIFQSEIMDQLEDERFAKMAAVDSTYDNRIRMEIDSFRPVTLSKVLREDPYYANKHDRRKELEAKKVAGNQAVVAAQEKVNCECNGACGTKKRGRGPACKSNEKEKARIEREFNANKVVWDREIRKLSAEMTAIEAEADTLKARIIADSEKQVQSLQKEWEARKTSVEKGFATSLLAQNTALTELSNTKPGVSLMVGLVTLLFIFLECAPIFVKFFSSKGPYDEAIEDLEFKYSSESRQRRYLTREEHKVNKDLIHRMANAQKDIMHKAMREWHKEQSENMADQYNRFIREDQEN